MNENKMSVILMVHAGIKYLIFKIFFIFFHEFVKQSLLNEDCQSSLDTLYSNVML